MVKIWINLWIFTGSTGKGAGKFAEVAKAGGMNSLVLIWKSYDATALITLAMQAGGGDRATIQANVMDVANAQVKKSTQVS